jgi:hypothetical protein
MAMMRHTRYKAATSSGLSFFSVNVHTFSSSGKLVPLQEVFVDGRCRRKVTE